MMKRFIIVWSSLVLISASPLFLIKNNYGPNIWYFSALLWELSLTGSIFLTFWIVNKIRNY